MAATLEGLVGVYNIDGTLAYSGVAKEVNILKGFSLTETGREGQLTRNGHIIGKASDERKRTISCTFLPYDPTSPGSTLATAKDKVVIPGIYGDLTIADFDIAIFDGTWTIVGDIGVTAKEGDYLEMTVTGEQYLQADGTWKALSQL